MCVEGGWGSYFNQWVKMQTRKNIVHLLKILLLIHGDLHMSLKTLAYKVPKMLAIDGQADGWKDG